MSVDRGNHPGGVKSGPFSGVLAPEHDVLLRPQLTIFRASRLLPHVQFAALPEVRPLQVGGLRMLNLAFVDLE
jgi:hypothetical protein